MTKRKILASQPPTKQTIKPKLRNYSLRTRLTEDEYLDLQRIRELYDPCLENLARGVLDNLRPLLKIEPSPKLSSLIRDYIHTNNPVSLICAQEEYSRLWNYDNKYKNEDELRMGLIPYYRDREDYERRTGGKDWDVHERRKELCDYYDNMRGEFPLILEHYPTFRHWEMSGLPDLNDYTDGDVYHTPPSSCYRKD